jgi:predicted lipoprotein with Yx(FWY)xxD motif
VEGIIVRKTLLMTAAAAGALVLAGCGGGGGGTAASNGSHGSTASAGGASPAAANSVADLKTFGSPLGAIVVDGKSMTVYAFDKDTAGAASACTGVCVPLWPAVTTTSATPSVQGVTGQVGTAPTADGRKQVTLDGHRLYTFSGDSSSGQVNGQGYMNLWWVVSPAGQQIKKAASSSAASSSSMSGGVTY